LPEQNRKGRAGQAELDRQNRTGKTDMQNRIGRTGQAEQDRQNRTARTGLPGKNCLTRLPGQDC
jgi:hypothetical protein